MSCTWPPPSPPAHTHLLMDDSGDFGGSALQLLSCGRLFAHALDQFNSRLESSVASLSAAIETVESSLVRPFDYQKPRVFVPGASFFSAPHGRLAPPAPLASNFFSTCPSSTKFNYSTFNIESPNQPTSLSRTQPSPPTPIPSFFQCRLRILQRRRRNEGLLHQSKRLFLARCSATLARLFDSFPLYFSMRARLSRHPAGRAAASGQSVAVKGRQLSQISRESSSSPSFLVPSSSACSLANTLPPHPLSFFQVWDALIAMFYHLIVEEKHRMQAASTTAAAASHVTLFAESDLALAWNVCVRVSQSHHTQCLSNRCTLPLFYILFCSLLGLLLDATCARSSASPATTRFGSTSKNYTPARPPTASPTCVCAG